MGGTIGLPTVDLLAVLIPPKCVRGQVNYWFFSRHHRAFESQQPFLRKQSLPAAEIRAIQS